MFKKELCRVGLKWPILKKLMVSGPMIQEEAQNAANNVITDQIQGIHQLN